MHQLHKHTRKEIKQPIERNFLTVSYKRYNVRQSDIFAYLINFMLHLLMIYEFYIFYDVIQLTI